MLCNHPLWPYTISTNHRFLFLSMIQPECVAMEAPECVAMETPECVTMETPECVPMETPECVAMDDALQPECVAMDVSVQPECVAMASGATALGKCKPVTLELSCLARESSSLEGRQQVKVGVASFDTVESTAHPHQSNSVSSLLAPAGNLSSLESSPDHQKVQASLR
jgi:hypothetical protein